MTRERAKELAPIIQAYGEGKAIETRTRYEHSTWRELVGDIEPAWSNEQDYRIKPEPKTRPMTRGEVLYMVTTTPSLVCRRAGADEYNMLPGKMTDGIQFDSYEWATIDKHGEPVDGWHKFEIEE